VLGRILTRSCARRREKASLIDSDDERTPLLGENHSAKSPQDQPEVKKHSWREVLSPQSTLVLLAYSLMSVHTMAFESMLPVFLHNPPQDLEDDPNVQLPFKFVGGFGMGKSMLSFNS
jgi:hypothetical protein